MTRYTHKFQLQTNEISDEGSNEVSDGSSIEVTEDPANNEVSNEGSNEVGEDPTNNEVSNEGSNEVAKDPANNAQTPTKFTDQTENNAPAHYKTFLMSICVLVLILL